MPAEYINLTKANEDVGRLISMHSKSETKLSLDEFFYYQMVFVYYFAAKIVSFFYQYSEINNARFALKMKKLC